MSKTSVAIIIPVFNDWDSLNLLIPKIDITLRSEELTVTVIIVNDGSTDEPEIEDDVLTGLSIINSIEIIHQNCNLGHQRAIAIGLSEVSKRKSVDAIVIMDADGEDRPEDIPVLVEQGLKEKEKIIVARRDRRSEGLVFKTGYLVYKLLFRLLTGKRIAFGNFCLLPIKIAKKLTYFDSLWNHLPATILKSKLPLTMVSTKRGERLRGKTKMNFGGLILLGLSAVSVYVDVALLRTLLLSICFATVTIIGIIVTTVIRLFTELAIPGWASGMVGSLTIILILSLVMSMFVLFVILANRSQMTIIPAKHISDYIDSVETIYPK